MAEIKQIDVGGTLYDIPGAVPSGGTAGQVLKKTSSTDYAASWGGLAASDVGAIPTSQKGSANGIASLDNRGKVTATQSTSHVSNITDAAVTVTEDMNGRTYILSASNAITVTVPDPASMPDGFEVEMVQWGTGKVSFAIDVSGKYIRSLDGARTIVGQYGVAVLKKIGSSTWLLAGALE